MSDASDKNGCWDVISTIIGAIIILVLFTGLSKGCSSSSDESSSSNTSTKGYTAQATPQNGAVLSGSSRGDAAVRISASNANAYVKIKKSNRTVVSFFVRSGSTAEVNISPDTYSVQFALGDTWYGTTACFGDDTSYGQDEKATIKYGEILSYDLKRSSTGNFSMQKLDASEF